MLQFVSNIYSLGIYVQNFSELWLWIDDVTHYMQTIFVQSRPNNQRIIVRIACLCQLDNHIKVTQQVQAFSEPFGNPK